jgi:hypothetical protein
VTDYNPPFRVPGDLGLCIVDATDPAFFPGRLLPRDWTAMGAGDEGGAWFFLPESDLREPGTYIAIHRQFPFCYSPGFATAGEACSAAQSWQDGYAARRSARREFDVIISEGDQQ